MEQVIFGGQGFGGPLDSAVTRHNSLQDGSSWFVAASEFRRYQVISTDGVIKNLRFRLSAAPGAGKKYTFTLMLNGNPTALTFDIADAATSGSNMVDEVAVTGGDTVDLQCVPDNTPTSVTAAWSSVFESDNPNESLIMGNPGGTLHRTATEYGQAMTSATELGVIENDRRQVIPTSGKITNLYVWLDVDPGTAPDAYRFTVRLNGATVAQSPIVTITANDKTGSDLVHELAVVAGDYITLMVEPVNTPSAWPYSAWGMTFVADEDGESIVIGGSYQGLDRWNSPRFGYISHVEGSGWDANENRRYMLGQVCTLKKLNVLITAPPGVGNQWDFTLRIEGADSNVTLDIVDPNTTGDSGALEDTVALSEYVVLRTDPTDIPDAADAYWGFVCYIEPPVPSGSEDLLGKFDVGQDSAELLGEAEIQQSGSAELLGKFEAQATAELFGKAVIRHSDTAELLGELDVGQGSAELLGKFEAQTTAELLGKAEVQQSGSAEILGKFEAQATAELLGRFEAQATAELLGKAEVQQSGSTELLSNAVIRHVGAPVELLGNAVIRHVGTPVELLGKADVQQSGSAELLGKFEAQVTAELLGKVEIQQSGSAELLGKAEVQQSGSAEILGNVEIRQSGSAELLGRAEVRQPDSAELLGRAVIRHVGTPVELLGRAIIRNVGSAELLGKAIVKNASSAELLGRAVIRHVGTPVELLGKAEVQQSGSAELLSKADIRQSGSAELLGKAIIRHSDSAELLGKAEVQQSGSAELLGEFEAQATAELLGRFEVGEGSAELLSKAVIRHSVTVDLYAFFESQASVNLSAKFQVTHSENLFSKLWIRHPSRLWTNRRYINGVVELDETELDDALLEYVIEGVMNDIRSQLISEAMLVYDSWTDITKTPKLIRRATTYGTVANLYSRDINDPNRRIVLGLRPMRIRAAEIRSAQERAMDYWESRMEKMMSLYLTSGGRRLIIVDTEDEEAVFSIDDIPFYSEDPFKIKVR